MYSKILVKNCSGGQTKILDKPCIHYSSRKDSERYYDDIRLKWRVLQQTMSRYYGGDDYDAFGHMTNDPVDTDMVGFGYDTSHVAKDEPHSELTLAAKSGNFNQVKRTVEAAKVCNSDEEKNSHARRWTEVEIDYMQNCSYYRYP
jgi:hypothetical protein